MSSTIFNPREHLMQLKSREGSKDYLPVAWRLVWFREAFPQGSIETELVHLDLDKDTEDEVFVWNSEKRRSEKVVKTAKGIAVFKATVKDGIGGVATGTKSEKAASFADFIEKAETGAIGRALAALGYGTQFAPEMDEAHRIVDAPVDAPSPIANASKSQQNSASMAIVPTDNAQAGYLLPAEIEQIKKDWIEVCNIKEPDIPQRWAGFKTHINNGTAVPDTQLTREHKDAMLTYLKPRRKKAS